MKDYYICASSEPKDIMPVPFEALLPYGIMLVVSRPSIGSLLSLAADSMEMFGITGGGMSYIRTMQNGGKRQRYCIGRWDEVRSNELCNLENSD